MIHTWSGGAAFLVFLAAAARASLVSAELRRCPLELGRGGGDRIQPGMGGWTVLFAQFWLSSRKHGHHPIFGHGVLHQASMGIVSEPREKILAQRQAPFDVVQANVAGVDQTFLTLPAESDSPLVAT
jgi:hypothetical protein